jgi:hypothetical protein
VKVGWVLQTSLGPRGRGATTLAATAQRSRTARGVCVSFFLSFSFVHFFFLFSSFFLSFSSVRVGEISAALLFVFVYEIIV